MLRWSLRVEWMPKNKTLSYSFFVFLVFPHLRKSVRRRRGQSLLHISCSCRNGRCTSTPLRYLQVYPDTGPLVVFASVVRQQWQWKLSIHCHITLMRSDESKDDRMPTLLDWKFCKFIFRKNERNLKLVIMVPPRR